MNTVQNNCNITKSKLQAFIKENSKKLGISDKYVEKIIKYIKLRKCTKEKVKIFFAECLKKINGQKSIKGKHLTEEERITIEVLFTAGIPNTIIAMFVGKNRSTIGREIKKGKEEKEDLNVTISYKKANCFKAIITYSAQKAQRKYNVNRARCKKPYKLEKNGKLREIVVKMIKGVKDIETNVIIKYSPEAISELLKQGKVKNITETISKTSIYNAVHTRALDVKISDLPHGRRYYKKINSHAQYKENTKKKEEYSIEKMPQEVKDKKTTTHFEGDSIIGKREGKNNTLITLVNTSSKFLFIERSKDKTAKAFVEVLNKLEGEIPELEKIMETLLLDNGCEFSDIEGIMKSYKDKKQKRLSVYYAHPYTSCERGCNENKNRDVRKDFPKGMLVEKLSDEDILNIARRINNTPRKILGWKTALEVFEEQLIEKKIDTKFLDKYRIAKASFLVA